jgi:site-specific DNA recombinase
MILAEYLVLDTWYSPIGANKMNAQTESKSILDNPTVLERAIIYARVSTDEQTESGTSIGNQIAKGHAYAEAAGLKVVEVFSEDFTGTTLDRPELAKVRAMLKSGLADNLIVYNNTRLDCSKFGRDTLVLFTEWYDLGVSVHFSETRQRVNLNDPLQVLLYGSFGGWNAGNDRDATVKKLADGRQSRAEQGFVVPIGAGAPYGYRAVKGVDKRWRFETYKPEAEIVKLIYHWYIFGDESGKPLTGQGITDKLTEMGIATWGDRREKSAKRRKAGE